MKSIIIVMSLFVAFAAAFPNPAVNDLGQGPKVDTIEAADTPRTKRHLVYGNIAPVYSVHPVQSEFFFNML